MYSPWIGITLCTALGLIITSGADAATYYVSSSVGDDANNGLAATRRGANGPWKTLARASQANYKPGDRLLLRCGDVWTDALTLRDMGRPEAPITISAYGTGARPAIHGNGMAGSACITLDRCAGWAIRGLELANAQFAIRLVLDSRTRTEYTGLSVIDCFMKDIANPAFPNVLEREGSRHEHLRNMGWAIYAEGGGSPQEVRLRQVTIRNNTALWCQGFYFHATGPIMGEDIHIDGNTLAHNSYNAIYHTGARRFHITRNALLYGYPWAAHPNGATQVLAGGLEGTAAEPNRVTHNEFGWGGDTPGAPDGCAYDFEGTTHGVVFQHNFVHNSSGEPILFMGGFTHTDLLFDNNIFRDCIRFSTRWHHYVTVSMSNTGNGVFSNNRFFLEPQHEAFMAKPPSFTFTNNDERATGAFVAMPQVISLSRDTRERVYTLACATPNAIMRYTTDGSLPDASSPKVTGPIRITRSCALNVKAFRDGMLPSYTNTLVVDLRDGEAKGPRAVVSTTANAAAQDRARATLQAVTGTFSLAFWIAPERERPVTPETYTGVTDTAGQVFALEPFDTSAPGNTGIAVSVGTNGVSVFETGAGDRPSLLVCPAKMPGWHHVVILVRQGQPSVYVDGIFQKAGHKSLKQMHPLFRLGAYPGQMRDVAVYDRLLTDAEIQTLAAKRR